MFAHYYVNISKQSNDIFFVFQRIRNSYIQFLRNAKKLKYNLITTNKYNQDIFLTL